VCFAAPKRTRGNSKVCSSPPITIPPKLPPRVDNNPPLLPPVVSNPPTRVFNPPPVVIDTPPPLREDRSAAADQAAGHRPMLRLALPSSGSRRPGKADRRGHRSGRTRPEAWPHATHLRPRQRAGLHEYRGQADVGGGAIRPGPVFTGRSVANPVLAHSGPGFGGGAPMHPRHGLRPLSLSIRCSAIRGVLAAPLFSCATARRDRRRGPRPECRCVICDPARRRLHAPPEPAASDRRDNGN